MLFASIDIGSNAVRLLFANVFDNNGIVRAEKATLMRIPIRLGMDVFEMGRISEQRADNLIKTLKAFTLLIEVYQPLAYRACATSAMREAENHDEIMQRIAGETGLHIDIIDGLEEARIISASNNMIADLAPFDCLYVDVGGGSTELSLILGHKFINSSSFRIGTIRLLQDKVEESEWKAMRLWIREHCKGLENLTCVGSGGNINKITKLFGDLQTNIIRRKKLGQAHKYLSGMSVNERIEKIGLRPDRADVIVPAANIFLRILEWTGLDYVLAPRIGLADGLVLLLYEDYMKERQGKPGS